MQYPKARKPIPSRLHILFTAVFVAGTVFAAGQQTVAQSPPSRKASSATRKPLHSHKNAATAPAQQREPPPPAPVAPKPPDWPANLHPSDATVVWNSQGLRIEASNSSLSQILKDVATATGTKVEGLSSDERIFGSYGPGQARDVMAQLLEGSGFNVLMIGDRGQGTPREIVLSNQPRGGAPPPVNNQTASNDESADADDQQQPQPQPQPQPPPAIHNGFAPGAPPRTPQQIMQELQQRQEQMQQGNTPPQ